jgi:hypothetical protein
MITVSQTDKIAVDTDEKISDRFIDDTPIGCFSDQHGDR